MYKYIGNVLFLLAESITTIERSIAFIKELDFGNNPKKRQKQILDFVYPVNCFINN